MASLGDRVFDAGLSALDTEANRLCICSQEPTSYAGANSTYRLGYKDTPTISAPADRTGGGREVTVSAISDGVVDATGSASHWAIIDTVNSRLLATGSLSSSQGVTSGNSFSLASFTIGIPDPA